MEYKTVGKITNLVCKDKTFQIKESEDQIAKLIEDLKQ